MVLSQFIIAIYNYADTQNTLSNSVAFIFARFIPWITATLSRLWRKESTLRARNFRGISVSSRWLELRFHIIRLQGKSCRTLLPVPLPTNPFYLFLCGPLESAANFCRLLTLYSEKSERITSVRTEYNVAIVFARYFNSALSTRFWKNHTLSTYWLLF